MSNSRAPAAARGADAACPAASGSMVKAVSDAIAARKERRSCRGDIDVLRTAVPASRILHLSSLSDGAFRKSSVVFREPAELSSQGVSVRPLSERQTLPKRLLSSWIFDWRKVM